MDCGHCFLLQQRTLLVLAMSAVAELPVIVVVDGGGISRNAAILFVSDESSS